MKKKIEVFILRFKYWYHSAMTRRYNRVAVTLIDRGDDRALKKLKAKRLKHFWGRIKAKDKLLKIEL